MKQLWARIAEALFGKGKKERTALWVAGWVARAASVIAGTLLGMAAPAAADLGMIVGQAVGALVLVLAPAAYDFIQNKKLTENAKHFENLSEKVIEALEVTKKDNIVDFGNPDSKKLLDHLLGEEGKALVDKIQNKLGK